MTTDTDEFESGPETFMQPTWVFRLGKRDSLLVLKALGGRLSDDEKAEAEALCDRLTLQRESMIADMLKGLTKAADAVRKKQDR